MHNYIFYALTFFYMILIWVGYHKVFNVIYFNTLKALFGEFVISLILGILLAEATVFYWYISVIIIALITLGIAFKASSSSRVIILVIGAILCIIVAWASMRIKKEQAESKITFEETEPYTITHEMLFGETEETDTYPKLHETISALDNFVIRDSTYVNEGINNCWLNIVVLNHNNGSIQAKFCSFNSNDEPVLKTYNATQDPDDPTLYHFDGKSEDMFIQALDNEELGCEFKDEDGTYSGMYQIATDEDEKNYNSMYASYVSMKEFSNHKHEYAEFISNADGTHSAKCTFEGCDHEIIENCTPVGNVCSKCYYQFSLFDYGVKEGLYISTDGTTQIRLFRADNKDCISIEGDEQANSLVLESLGYDGGYGVSTDYERYSVDINPSDVTDISFSTLFEHYDLEYVGS